MGSNRAVAIGTRVGQSGVRAPQRLAVSALNHQVHVWYDSNNSYSKDIPFSDIPEIAWDCSSLSTCSDLFPLVDCSYSITTNPDFDTHSELGYKHNKVPVIEMINLALMTQSR